MSQHQPDSYHEAQTRRPRLRVIQGGDILDQITASLNPEQRRAVTRQPGPVLVLAGAGTGKTEVIAYRIAFLIFAGYVRPEEILAITFTNKAARQMRQRLEELCGELAQRINVGTFHTTCSRILRAHAEVVERSSHFTIYDNGDTLRAIKATMTQAEGAVVSPKQVQKEISYNKNQSVSIEQYEACAFDSASKIVARAWRVYEEELTRSDALDFDDLLLETVRLLTCEPEILEAYQEKWKAILVDEYQDTNPTQARLLRLLAATGNGHRNLFVVGDEDQAIYSFRLADVRLIREFDREYRDAEVILLEQNYRSSPKILAGSNRLIRHNPQRREKTLYPDKKNEDGPDIMVHASRTDAEEAKWIALQIRQAIETGVPERDIAILARYGSVVERIEHALAAAGVGYELLGTHGFFGREEIKAVLAHFRVLVNPRDEAGFATAMEVRPGVGVNTVAKIIAYAKRNGLTMLEAATAVELIGGITAEPREHIARFAYEMLTLAGQVSARSVSSLTQDVIQMPHGVAESFAKARDSERRLSRLQALKDAARTYERQNDTPTLEGWLQDAALAGQEDHTIAAGRNGKVTLGTVHGGKGLEWRTVIGAGIEQFVLPSFYAKTPERLEEERRMAYVLETRARRVLVLSYSLFRHGQPAAASQFIYETTGAADPRHLLLPGRVRTG